MESDAACPPWSWNLLEHPLAEGINTGLIPEEVLPVTKEGKAATSHLKISLHPSGNGLTGACGPENVAGSWEGGSGPSFQMLLWFKSSRGWREGSGVGTAPEAVCTWNGLGWKGL